MYVWQGIFYIFLYSYGGNLSSKYVVNRGYWHTIGTLFEMQKKKSRLFTPARKFIDL